MSLKSRLDRVERKLLPAPEVKIVVTKSNGHCPTAEEKARINAASGVKHIWVCHCKNCEPEFYERKVNEKKNQKG